MKLYNSKLAPQEKIIRLDTAIALDSDKFNLTIPCLMPDELLLGYFGRLSKQNGFNDYLLAKKFINKIYTDRAVGFKHYPLALQMSDLLNIEPDKLASKHTLTPILRSIDHKNRSISDIKILQSQGCCLAKGNVYLCEKCVEEDMDYLGFSFWRVSHQIHGVDFCFKHHSPLLVANDDQSSFNTPYDVWRNKKFEITNISEDEFNNPIIQNYIQLIEDHINHQASIDIKSVINYLRFRFDLQNIEKKNGCVETISDLILKNAPQDWLLKHFPIFRKKTIGDTLRCIDLSHLKGRTSLMHLLLMLSCISPEIGYFELRNLKPNINKLDANTYAAFTDFLTGGRLEEIMHRESITNLGFENLLRGICQNFSHLILRPE